MSFQYVYPIREILLLCPLLKLLDGCGGYGIHPCLFGLLEACKSFLAFMKM